MQKTDSNNSSGQKMSYKEKFIQMNKEAKAIWICTAIVIAFWWLTGFGIYFIAASWTILGMPAWFVISCFGSWFLAIALIVFVTKSVFKDFSLDDDDKKEGK